MQNTEQQELHCCYASKDELVMTEDIKQVLDEQSKKIWKEIEEKLFDEFMKTFYECMEEMFPGLAK
jgi:predicted RNA-binding protein with EMAP domain